ncbi:MAG: GNAT family N-acetyltransferase [Nanobdellota archaeon]
MIIEPAQGIDGKLKEQVDKIFEGFFHSKHEGYVLHTDNAYVAHNEERVAGFIELDKINPVFMLGIRIPISSEFLKHCSKGIYIDKIAIDPDFRNIAMGENLVYAGVEMCRDSHRLKGDLDISSSVLTLENEHNPSGGFWEHLGFNHIGSYTHEEPGIALQHRVYQKDI